MQLVVPNRAFFRTLSIRTVTSGARAIMPLMRRKRNGVRTLFSRSVQYFFISRYSTFLRRATISRSHWRLIVVVSLSIRSPAKVLDTRIFSPLAVAGLCVTIGHYWYLFKGLTAVSAGRFYRFEHIETYSSGKVVAKLDHPVGKLQKRTLECA
jgi:hypothetical protein